MTLISHFGGLEVPSGAIISDCGRYRFTLWRALPDGHAGMCVNFIMLNPSTADHEKDDPTIRRCIGYARSWGFGKLIITNLFALRSTSPRVLEDDEDPIGEGNDKQIMAMADQSHRIILAWGNHGAIRGRGKAVRKMLDEGGVMEEFNYCLGMNKTGEPVHPLYQPKDLEAKRMRDFICK